MDLPSKPLTHCTHTHPFLLLHSRAEAPKAARPRARRRPRVQHDPGATRPLFRLYLPISVLWRALSGRRAERTRRGRFAQERWWAAATAQASGRRRPPPPPPSAGGGGAAGDGIALAPASAVSQSPAAPHHQHSRICRMGLKPNLRGPASQVRPHFFPSGTTCTHAAGKHSQAPKRQGHDVLIRSPLRPFLQRWPV